MQVFELNLDGLVGPTHHYAGLSTGNLASTTNAFSHSNPQAAARQGIAKMRLLLQMGVKQALIPPHQRPNLHLLKRLGFRGTPAQQLQQAQREAPELLSACYSASSMWAANTATVSASSDTADGRVHFTAANLVANFHRHQEASFSSLLLKKLFNDPRRFKHHQPLPNSLMTSDEGAANYSRLCASHDKEGIHLFVYGKRKTGGNPCEIPIKYPARQTLEASQAIARLHRLDPDKVIFTQQNPKVIDQGVFHNDVIAVANEFLLFIHEEAMVNQSDCLKRLQTTANFPLHIIEVTKNRISVDAAVKSYLFNSQLVTLPEKQQMALIAPVECQENIAIKTFIEELLADSTVPISQVYYLNLKQSMQNGGGPACLRLRVPLTTNELEAMHQPVLVTESLLESLDAWIGRHYRSQLHPDDFADPQLMNESFTALDELTKLLELGSIYSFQREKNF